MMKNYQSIAAQLDTIARANLKFPPEQSWIDGAEQRIKTIMDSAPHGSGIDCCVQLDDSSTPNHLVFALSFHHMNDGGMYDGWSKHSVVITPDLISGYNICITGRDRNQIKEYLYDVMSGWLDTAAPEYVTA